MHVKRYHNINNFLKENLTFLEQAEAVNNLPIGIPTSIRDVADPLINLYTVFENDVPVFSLVHTPPKNFLIYAPQINPKIFEALFPVLEKDSIQAAGVIGPKDLAIAFAEFRQARTGRTYDNHFEQLVYQLDQVKAIDLSKGHLRKASTQDFSTVAQWLLDFSEQFSFSSDPKEIQAITSSKIAAGNIFIWEDEIAVSMAAVARPTRNGITVNYVYTPPQYRGRGYASSCVAQLSELMLEQYKFCCLFTDATNPTSNRIYQNIGYYPLAEFRELKFL